MPSPIHAYVFGTFKLGKTVRKPDVYANRILKDIPVIRSYAVLTGDWDAVVDYTVKDMDEYYETAWKFAQYLEKAFGTIVTSEFKRPTPSKKPIIVYLLGCLELGHNLQPPEKLIGNWLAEYPAIQEVYVITGVWDVLVKIQVDDMKEYFHTAWGLGRYLTRGAGYVVSKKIR